MVRPAAPRGGGPGALHAGAPGAEEGRPGSSDLGEGRVAGRLATEQALEDAALELLRRDGVLAGLNLREVADTAGVNRGLVYHYYGSRGKLLRRALRRRGRANLEKLRGLSGLAGARRWRRFFEVVIANPEPVQLQTLLLMDGTETLRSTPLREEAMRSIERDVEEGYLVPGVDRIALHTIMVTGVYGYVLYRQAFAREHDVPVEELDERVAGLFFGPMLEALTPAGGGSVGRGSRRG